MAGRKRAPRGLPSRLLALTRARWRSGLYGSSTDSVTRYWVYDDNQRLCKTVDPESWSTVQAYDAAGNVAWRASGLALNGDVCSQDQVPAARKISFGYDAMDRLTSTSYGDGSPGIGRSYTADGLLGYVASGNLAWSYVYNNRRIRTQELYTWWAGATPGQGWNFTRTIDGYGNVSALTDPSGALYYAPNALGEPSQVSGYASNVTYDPSGTLVGYTLANGVFHSTTLNVRGLPQYMTDVGVISDEYSYDANGNVSSITDQQEGGLTSRSMGYDWADRLSEANGVWGNARYTYDAIDNVRTASVGSRNATFSYDTSNRLASAAISGGSAIYGYDVNGNMASRTGSAVQDLAFNFDIGNRLWGIPGKANHSYDGHGRRGWTALPNGSYNLSGYAATAS